jgi:tetratricopeptide (TPR) repeat protein
MAFRDSDATPASLKYSALFSALFFSLHPLRVESVSWISTRADLLCCLFLSLSLFSYLKSEAEAIKNKRLAWGFATFVFFMLGTLSRAWAITFPFVLLLVDFYPRKKLPDLKAVFGAFFRKTPFFLMALIGAGLAIAGKLHAMPEVGDYGIFRRIMQSTFGICFYMSKTVFPAELSPLYLLDRKFDVLSFVMLGAAISVFVISLLSLLFVRRAPWFFVTWWTYVIIVSPVLGLVQSGIQLTADRYTYIACLPFALLLGAGILKFREKSAISINMLFLIASLYLMIIACVSMNQVKIWRDNISLWNRVLEINPENYIAYYNRGHWLGGKGESKKAFADYSEAIRLNPQYAEAYYNRAKILMDAGDCKLALNDLNAAIFINPRYSDAYCNRAEVQRRLGNSSAARQDLDRLIIFSPKMAEAYFNRALIHWVTGDSDASISDYSMAIKLKSDYADAYFNRGNIYGITGVSEKALADYCKYIELKPGSWRGYYNRGILFKNLARKSEALEDMRKARSLITPNDLSIELEKEIKTMEVN